MTKSLCSILLLLFLVNPLSAQSSRNVNVDTSDRPRIDVDSYSIEATLLPEEHKLAARAAVRFKQLDRNNFATFDLDRRLRVSSVTLGGTQARFRQFDLDSTLEVDLSGAEFGSDPTVNIEYSGILDPEEDRREPVLGKISEESAFLLYAAKWFPTNGLDLDKAQLRLTVNGPPGWTVVTDIPADSRGGYVSDAPGYWGTIAAGQYIPTNIKVGTSEITINSLNVAEDVLNPMAEAAGKILEFYSGVFGPAPAASKLKIVEIKGANWNSQWSTGVILLPTSQFRKDFDMPELARTVAHQWFPLKIGVKDPTKDAWLADGMSVFASLLYFDKTLSPAESQEHIDKALVKALAYEGSGSLRQPGGMGKESPEFLSLVRYRGAYVLRMLQWLIGDEQFKDLLTQYVQRFSSTPASTESFAQMASKIAGGDLTYFFDQWLNTSSVPEMKIEYTVFRTARGYKIMGQITQDLDLFKMPVELQIQTDGEPEYARVEVVGPSSDFDIVTQRKPKQILIDPRKKILRMSPDIRVAVLINRGEEYSSETRYNDALDQFQKAIDINPTNSLAHFRMAEALFELGNLQAAANVFREALNGDLKPKWVEVWAYVNLGKILDIRGQRERALGEYQKAVNTGDDSYGAQGEAQKYLQEPFRRAGNKATIL